MWCPIHDGIHYRSRMNVISMFKALNLNIWILFKLGKLWYLPHCRSVRSLKVGYAPVQVEGYVKLQRQNILKLG